MSTIPTLEEAQKRLDRVYCPDCLKLLSDDAERDRRIIWEMLEEIKLRQAYFRKVAFYIKARQQAVKYQDVESYKDDQWGGNLDD
jgi:hypothetical protein